MRKVLIGLSVLVVLTFVIILTVSAKNNDFQSKTTNTEISQDIACCASIDICCGISNSKIASCDPTNCSTMKCDQATCKGGKCDPASCKGVKCDQATCIGGKCNTAGCKQNCGGVAKAMSCRPMNCNR